MNPEKFFILFDLAYHKETTNYKVVDFSVLEKWNLQVVIIDLDIFFIKG